MSSEKEELKKALLKEIKTIDILLKIKLGDKYNDVFNTDFSKCEQYFVDPEAVRKYIRFEKIIKRVSLVFIIVGALLGIISSSLLTLGAITIVVFSYLYIVSSIDYSRKKTCAASKIFAKNADGTFIVVNLSGDLYICKIYSVQELKVIKHTAFLKFKKYQFVFTENDDITITEIEFPLIYGDKLISDLEKIID